MQRLHLWQFISTRLKAHHNLFLLTVPTSTGSSPGRPGFKMAVDEQGALSGSIGGGIMEVKLVDLAKEHLKKGAVQPLLKRQIHHKTAPRDQSGMICSGEQTVVFIPLKKADLPVINRLIRCLRRQNTPAILRMGELPESGCWNIRKMKSITSSLPKTNMIFYLKKTLGSKTNSASLAAGTAPAALIRIESRKWIFISGSSTTGPIWTP